MGAWGHKAFDNDTACDWVYDLEKTSDLSLVEQAFARVEEAGADYLDSDPASEALAACEVLARLQGRPGYTSAYTESLDALIKAHPQRVPPQLLARAHACIDRILGEDSELRDLWDDVDGKEWYEAVEELRKRMG